LPQERVALQLACPRLRQLATASPRWPTAGTRHTPRAQCHSRHPRSCVSDALQTQRSTEADCVPQIPAVQLFLAVVNVVLVLQRLPCMTSQLACTPVILAFCLLALEVRSGAQQAALAPMRLALIAAAGPLSGVTPAVKHGRGVPAFLLLLLRRRGRTLSEHARRASARHGIHAQKAQQQSSH